MGGQGSGNWYRWHKKTTVEAARNIDVARWVHEGIVRADMHHAGSWVWTNAATGKQTASISYEVQTNERGGWVRVRYTLTRPSGERIPCDYQVPLVTTQPHFGGVRWWFVCPLVVKNRACMRRVGKLYLPGRATYYGCRHCYNLTYTSSQESDTRVSRLARDSVALYQFMEQSLDQAGDDMLTGAANVLLALKASRKREARLRADLKKLLKE